MRSIFLTEMDPVGKISYYHLLLFLVLLPFDSFYSDIVLISLLVHTLIHLNKNKIPGIKWPLFLPAAIYLITLAASLYTKDELQAHMDREKQLALLIFPLIL